MAAVTTVWSFRPQEVVTDTLDTTGNTWLSFAGPRSSYSGRPTTTETSLRSMKLRYVAVTSSTLDNMVQFYNARRGPFEAFFWYNVVDQTSYIVRFGEAITAQTGPYVSNISAEVVFVVTSG
jgi:hypothetical protein